MNVHLSQRAIEALAAAPLPVQKAFIKQINFFVRNLNRPSLHAKKYDEAEERWQARVNDDVLPDCRNCRIRAKHFS